MIEGPESDYLGDRSCRDPEEETERSPVDSSPSVSNASPASSGRIRAAMRVHVMGGTESSSAFTCWGRCRPAATRSPSSTAAFVAAASGEAGSESVRLCRGDGDYGGHGGTAKRAKR